MNLLSIKRCGLQQRGGALVGQRTSANQSFDNPCLPTFTVDARLYPAEIPTDYVALGHSIKTVGPVHDALG
ncbi:hypothetical protein [Methylomonas methanica]|uniref:hypothetical protein n=1 Tax=Methylomonas methanica TaxID=421 RepID=UPI0002FE5523|nr:hypothetical protein [Methylomonas methanica]